MLDDLKQNFVKALDDVCLLFAQGHLIGNLKDVAKGFSAFAVKAADGKAEFVDALDDLVDLLGEDQAGQVQHGADANAGTNISRARRQVAEIVAESVIELLFQFGIDLINGHPCLFELQAGAQSLHAKMILFVDHHAEGFFPVQDEAAATAFGGVLAADEMAFD